MKKKSKGQVTIEPLKITLETSLEAQKNLINKYFSAF